MKVLTERAKGHIEAMISLYRTELAAIKREAKAGKKLRQEDLISFIESTETILEAAEMLAKS